MATAVYDPFVYEKLREVELVAEEVQEKDLAEVGLLIRKYGMEKLIGVSLLHRHFDINSDEVMVETIDLQKNESVCRPQPMEKDVFPTIFKFIDASKLWQPVQFANNLQPKHEFMNEQLMQDLGNLLKERDLTDTFGMSIIKKDVLCKDGEMLLEENYSDRVSVVRPVTHWKEGTIKTMYRFDGKQCDGCTPTQVCRSAGSGHVVGYSHQRN
jgi:hypothetical protein